jgi:hypothetical protein
VTVPLLAADPYVTSTATPAALSTSGTPLLFNCDDCFRTQALPFAFPYFGTNYNSVKISSNGNLYFEPPTAPTRNNGDADDVPSSVTGLARFKMIAGMWDDLDLRTSRRPDADVYLVQPDANRIIFRWQGVQFGDGVNGAPINFETELNSNGTITTRYGAGNTNLFPVVGISGGEPDVYVISSLTSETTPLSLTNAQSAIFTPRSLVPSAPPDNRVSAPVSQPAAIPSSTEALNPIFTPTAAGDATVAFVTSDGAGTQNCAVINGMASARCDYMPVIRNITFAAGETIKTINIPITNDSYVEGNETFNVALSNPTGAALGSQASATVTILDDDTANGANPSDLSSFFVRQHYLDFLNREADPSGLNFWTNNIDGCTPQPACTGARRVDTSAAFYLSIEFQETGFLVERIYKVAYSDTNGNSTLNGSHSLSVPIVKFNEFLADAQEIGQGVVVGQGNWQQNLEANKQAFTQEFVQRSRFTNAYPVSITPSSFATQLFSNAGVTPTPSALQAVVAEFGGAADTSDPAARARAVRDVAENAALIAGETNRAFVLMQYFGYLRRDPNTGPDADFTGYDFWLTKLNQFGGNFQNAEMVKAVITSLE